MALPAVWLARHLGLDMRSAFDDGVVQRYLAAMCLGICFVLIFVLCRRYLTYFPALLLASGVALGTPLASTTGTAFWSIDPTLIFMLLALIWGLPCPPSGPSRPRLAGAALFLAFICRPTAAALILPLYTYLALYHRKSFFRSTAISLALLVGFSLWSFRAFGQFLPPYYLPTRIAADSTFWTAIYGNLISPSRGIFICSPLLAVFLAYALYHIRLTSRRP